MLAVEDSVQVAATPREVLEFVRVAATPREVLEFVRVAATPREVLEFACDLRGPMRPAGRIV